MVDVDQLWCKIFGAIEPKISRGRLGGVFFLLAAAGLYIPLNHNLHGGTEVILPLDQHIPLLPGWVFVYLSAFLFWGISIFWSVRNLTSSQFRSVFLADISMVLLAMCVFYFAPTFVTRPTIHVNNLSTWLLMLVYNADGVYNACPSGHVYQTGYFCLFFAQKFPQKIGLWATIFLLISLSTLFTHQHYIADVIAGSIFALGGFGLFRFLESRQAKQ